MQMKKVVYRVPATGTRSPRIAYRQTAINNSLALNPSPKPSHNPTLTAALTLTLTPTPAAQWRAACQPFTATAGYRSVGSGAGCQYPIHKKCRMQFLTSAPNFRRISCPPPNPAFPSCRVKLTRMVLQRVFSICLLDLVVGGIFANSEKLVVVFPLAFLQLQLSLLQQPTVF